MDEVFAQSKKFFGLPTDEKMKVLKNKISRGYTPLFDERLGPSDQVNGDHKEGYYIGVEIPADDSEAPNVWPDADLLLGWRQTMQEYLRQALEVARTVARGIALALDLDANFFDKREMLGDPNATLRLLHYNGGPKIPRQVSDPSRGIYGAGAHSDFGLITLLATDDVPGLQICKNKDAEPQLWEDVAPLKGRVSKSSSDNIKAFIVNLGDMLERWSNCIFKSTLHRVIGNGHERYSVAFFLDPNVDCIVECLPSCKSQTNPPNFISSLAHPSNRHSFLQELATSSDE